MVRTNASTNKKHMFYNKTSQSILQLGRDCATTVGFMCAHFVYVGNLVKTQVENDMDKIFYLQGHNIDVYNQVVFALIYVAINY